jgi:hypothetical protein
MRHIKRTFGHAVQTSQIAPLSDADAQIVMLPIERIGQEVGKWFRLVHGCDALFESAFPLRYWDWRDSSWHVKICFSYRRICHYAPRLYRADCLSSYLMFATGCRQSPCGRHRP